MKLLPGSSRKWHRKMRPHERRLYVALHNYILRLSAYYADQRRLDLIQEQQWETDGAPAR